MIASKWPPKTRSAVLRRARGAGLAVGLVMAIGASAHAQQGQAPVPLFPTPGQDRSTPGGGAIIQPSAPVLGPGQTGPSGIEVRDLGGPDPDAAGTLDARRGGLSSRMWTGTTRGDAVRLLEALPVRAPSHAMQDLMRRLLLTAATPPLGPTTVSPDEATGGILTPIRVQRLFDMARLTDVSDFIGALPPAARSGALEKARTDALILVGETEAACSTAEEAILEDSAPYWQKVLVYCDLLAGRTDQAALGMSMLRELGHEDGPFFQMAEMLGGLTDTAPEKMGIPEPLVLALYRAANAPIPATVAEPGLPWLDLVTALTGSADPDLRLVTGERAEATGALPSDALRFMYADMPFSDAEFTQEWSTVAAVPTPTNRALLYQKIEALDDIRERARALSVSLYTARATGASIYLTLARTMAPLMRSIPPDPALAADGAALARGLYAAGDLSAARAWVAALQTLVETNRPVANALDELKQFDQMAVGAAFAPVGGWPVAQAGDTTDGASEPAVEPGTDPQALRRMAAAAQRGAMAETVAEAMIALGRSGPGSADPMTLTQVTDALARVGLAQDAGSIALEAALTRWVTNTDQ